MARRKSSCSTTCERACCHPTSTMQGSIRSIAMCWRTTAWSRCLAALETQIERARWSLAWVMHRRRHSKVSALKVLPKRKHTWITGKNGGPTSEFTGPPNARWRLCSLKKSLHCNRCPSSHSVITSTASARFTWTDAWRWKQPITVPRRAGSDGAYVCSGTDSMCGCSIPTPASFCASTYAKSVAGTASRRKTGPSEPRWGRCNCWRAPTRWRATLAPSARHCMRGKASRQCAAFKAFSRFTKSTAWRV